MTIRMSIAGLVMTLVLAVTPTCFGVIIDFAGGTATLDDASTVVTTNSGLWNGIVDYYVEDGIKVDFVGGYGTIGDYQNEPPYCGNPSSSHDAHCNHPLLGWK